MKIARAALLCLLPGAALPAQTLPARAVDAPGLHKPVEILRDRWGVPHIYASDRDDLFFAQGYITAEDRLFQIDLWRRIGSGKLSEILGPSTLERDRLARSVNFRGDWNREWNSYGPGTRAIVASFTTGINAYIRGLHGKRPKEFALAGYDPGEWTPEDCVTRIAGLLMTGNLVREVRHATDIRQHGLDWFLSMHPPAPPVAVEIPQGLDLLDIQPEILRTYTETVSAVHLPGEQGSNNWVVDGTMTATGRPILANDPHRPVQLPSLRKTVHLVAPGWNAIGSGEPSLPGIAIGHNDHIAFGITIVGIDQQDLYVEKLNPDNPAEYRWAEAWKPFETKRETFHVKGEPDRTLELMWSVHGPVIDRDLTRHRAYALRWVGAEPGTAGYLAGLALAQAGNWAEFRQAVAHYKVPSENLVYADMEGNIGWHVAGLTPVRRNWSGLLPVPGDEGRYEWRGFQPAGDLPHEFNPARHFIATANHNIVPPGYNIPLGYDGWAPPFRVDRIREMLSSGKKFDVVDFARMQGDVTSLAARQFQKILKLWQPDSSSDRGIREQILEWDGSLRLESREALIYEVWTHRLAIALFGSDPASRNDVMLLLKLLEAKPDPDLFHRTLGESMSEITGRFGADQSQWKWGKLHHIVFRHPVSHSAMDLGPVARPGDATTVNATSGLNYQQTNGASWREVIDVGDWDRSLMTNTPGESGNPDSKHYSDLLTEWAAGRYHPMPFSRKAVEAAAEERLMLRPAN